MSETPVQRDRSNELDPAALEQAAEWVVRLNDAAVTENDFLSWQAWLAEDSAHARAFQELQEAWRRSANLSQLGVANADLLRAMREEISTLRNRDRRMRRIGWRLAPLAAALIAAIAVTVWQNGSDVVQTSTAELRSVRLPDGSRAVLGPETRLELRFSQHARSLTLSGGQAHFEVARAPQRPFSVETPAGSIVAVGTAFSVNATGARVAVVVTAGSVRVEPVAIAGSETAAPIVLTAGHRLVLDRKATLLEPLRSIEDAVAWRQGRLEYQAEALRVVIDDVNRYSRVKLLLADPALGELRYTGTVFPDALDAWVASIEGVFPVRIEVVDGQRLIVRAAADPRD